MTSFNKMFALKLKLRDGIVNNFCLVEKNFDFAFIVVTKS